MTERALLLTAIAYKSQGSLAALCFIFAPGQLRDGLPAGDAASGLRGGRLLRLHRAAQVVYHSRGRKKEQS